MLMLNANEKLIRTVATLITKEDFEKEILPLFIKNEDSYGCPSYWGLDEGDCIYYSDGGGCGQCWLNSLESSNINFKDEVENNED